MAIASVKELPVEGKRVFVRVDFNVPLTPAGGVADDARIRGALPTIEHLVKRGARVVLGSHLGRPKGKVDAALSLEPVGARLAELVGAEVHLADEPVGDGARKVVADLREGQIALLENLRFEPGEEDNDDVLGQQLASYADVYVNDAFGTAHRAHASTAAMVSHFEPGSRGAGFLMLRELEFLAQLVGKVDRPYVAVIGGAKVSDKITVLESLSRKVDTMLIGGAMANTFLAAEGHAMGKSKLESDRLSLARKFLDGVKGQKVKVMLPTDLVVAGSVDATDTETVAADRCPEDAMALDIGPETARDFAAEIARARTVFWNGPMGLFEKQPFAAGTMKVAHAMAQASKKAGGQALTVVGGGDSAAAAAEAGVDDKVDHVSTGGGASLELIEGKTLPGVAALEAN